MAKIKPKTTQIKDRDQKILEPNTLLKTDKAHKNWYSVNEMGKQGGKPKSNMKAVKKVAGKTKHSLRKEK